MSDILFTLEQQKKKRFPKGLIFGGVFFVLAIIIVAVINSLLSPVILKQEKNITIPEGYSIIQTGNKLESEGLIRSALAFRVLAQYDKLSIKSGPYQFVAGSVSLQEVLQRVSSADYGNVYNTITIPEGSTVKQIADIIQRSSFTFDQTTFDESTREQEGYLFPDTYSFLPDTETATIIKTLQKTFEDKTQSLQSSIEQSGRSFKDIIIMASIIEKEATGSLEEQKIVSGILWKRIDEGKMLQVDAPFKYIHDVVRASDLRIDGPYNTYMRTGLTPTPIGNPGMAAIKAAINPISSPYYFYLHGKDGQIHYGKTYREHVNNINRYLR